MRRSRIAAQRSAYFISRTPGCRSAHSICSSGAKLRWRILNQHQCSSICNHTRDPDLTTRQLAWALEAGLRIQCITVYYSILQCITMIRVLVWWVPYPTLPCPWRARNVKMKIRVSLRRDTSSTPKLGARQQLSGPDRWKDKKREQQGMMLPLNINSYYGYDMSTITTQYQSTYPLHVWSLPRRLISSWHSAPTSTASNDEQLHSNLP